MRKVIILIFAMVTSLSFAYANDISVKCSNKYSNSDHNKHNHTYYSICYINSLKCPEYVTWTLTSEQATEAEASNNRTNDFRVCNKINNSVSPKDYKNSGFDKGHMCPNNDFDFSKESASETFFMCNMCPQTHAMNAGKWKDLENLDHEYAKQFGHIDVCCGPIFDSKSDTIASGRVHIPYAFFRIFYNKENNFTECYIVTQENVSTKVELSEIENKTGLTFKLGE